MCMKGKNKTAEGDRRAAGGILGSVRMPHAALEREGSWGKEKWAGSPFVFRGDQQQKKKRQMVLGHFMAADELLFPITSFHLLFCKTQNRNMHQFPPKMLPIDISLSYSRGNRTHRLFLISPI